ncbi:hypothetical protein [Kitasatospora herbaricolor]|uniref:Uncharacterized protein n=1 Tax=Kitasatospora herbaricolor TaxID=68217 RepID=A0ABZ1WMP4_9ACTN|nr:hypothetical protein [Kitasatospora herbaricolor]
MNTRDTEDVTAPLRGIAQDPEAFAAYLAQVQLVLLGIGTNLQVLRDETRVHLRATHVEGDRFYHARLRALPVERALKDVLGHVQALTEGLEKSTFKRRAHADDVNSLPGKRKEKAQAKAQKKNPAAIAPAPEFGGGVPVGPDSGYAGPASIYDLGDRRSA